MKLLYLAVVCCVLPVCLQPSVSFAETKTGFVAVPTLKAVTLKAEPLVDGLMDDVWADAPKTTIRVHDGANLPGGESLVSMRAARVGDSIHFLVRYSDPTLSLRRAPWQKQSDGAWKQLLDPNDRGHDNNLYYEDKLAFFWDINSPSFYIDGCAATCHEGQGKPYGNHYTDQTGELLDIWHLKTVRTVPVGQMDDQYLDDERYDSVYVPKAGRKSDPKDGGGYVSNKSANSHRPAFAAPGNIPAGDYWILEREKDAFNDAAYKPGDEVAGIVTAPFEGDRGDIVAAATWKDGMWTCEIKRKLVTGSPYDVQFDDLMSTYSFGVAVFDNSQVRHAFHNGAVRLLFR